MGFEVLLAHDLLRRSLDQTAENVHEREVREEWLPIGFRRSESLSLLPLGDHCLQDRETRG